MSRKTRKNIEKNIEKVFVHKLFLNALKAKGLNTNTFAIKSGISSGTIGSWKNVRHLTKPENIEKIEKILEVKYDDLCMPADLVELERQKNVTVIEDFIQHMKTINKDGWPLIGHTHGGPWIETIEESEYPGDSEERVQAPEGVNDPNGFALEVNGDSMEPIFPDGCKILVSPNTQPAPGQYAVVIANTRLGNRESCFKQIFFDEKREKITLHSLNSKYPDIVIPMVDIYKVLPAVEVEIVTRKSFK